MNRRFLKNSLCLLFALGIGGCHAITIRPEGTQKQISKPTSSVSYDFFLWGLIGEEHVDVTKVCARGKVTQVQPQMTFVDGLLNVVTLGIYSPRSVRIWCD